MSSEVPPPTFPAIYLYPREEAGAYPQWYAEMDRAGAVIDPRNGTFIEIDPDTGLP